MNAQDLKNSILQLAVQGKLVEQRPKEGTAKELLAQIKSEKEQLIKDKKIKKEKPLPEISDEEIPFEIPETWEWGRLNIFCQLIDGEKVTEVDMPYLEAAYLRGKKLAEYKTNGKFVSKGQYAVLVDGENSGEVFVIPEDGILGSTFKILNISCSMYDKYVIKVLGLYKNLFKNNKKGAAIPHLDKSLFSSLVVGLPPFEEQRRIVAKIEEILPYIEQYDKAYTKLEAFNKKFPEDMKKSILQMAMQGKLVEQRPEEGTADDLYEQIVAEKTRLIKEGKIKKEKPLAEISEDEIPFEVPESWKWVRLSSICNVSDGTHQTPTYVEDGMPFISAQNVKPFKFMPHTYRCVSREAYEEYNKMVAPEKGDILMTRVGAGIGETAIIDVDMEFSIYVSLTLIKCYLKNYDMKYLLYVLNSPHGRKLAEKKTLGKSASQGNLNLIFIREFLIPLPPLAEQKRIVAKLEQMLPYCDRLIK